LTDIIDLILQDHHAVTALFDKLQAATEPAERAALFAEVKEDLERHVTAEEKVLYPRVRKEVAGGNEEAKDANEEHDQIRAALKEVGEHETGSELFSLAVNQLVATTKHHVGVEETELLPDFRASSEVAEREDLGLRFEEAKNKAAVS
jgi:iron-sulfur cluster repair protein YtfE (RIC family)